MGIRQLLSDAPSWAVASLSLLSVVLLVVVAAGYARAGDGARAEMRSNGLYACCVGASVLLAANRLGLSPALAVVAGLAVGLPLANRVDPSATERA